MIASVLVGLAAAAPVPVMGLEWRPLSRGDLTWVIDGNGTGLTVGGLDGFAHPSLSAFGGAWLTRRVGVFGSLGVARLQNTTRVGGVTTQRHWGVVRPGVDTRLTLFARDSDKPVPWLLVGTHVDVPSARDVSNGYTDEEQELADEAATADRLRLGAVGARLGVGASLDVSTHLTVGMQYALTWQRSLFVGNDPAAVSSLILGQAALLASFRWPRTREVSP
ncbi:MAG: hypothetical protein KTR31_37470 [Myxococcales bacterium]|nr:hypothetical protein [Myxococcales bacterium]